MPRDVANQYALNFRFFIQTRTNKPGGVNEIIRVGASSIEDLPGDTLRVIRGVMSGSGCDKYHPHNDDLTRTGESMLYVAFLSHSHIHIARYECAGVIHKPVINLNANEGHDHIALEAFEYKVKWREVVVLPIQEDFNLQKWDDVVMWGSELPDLEALFESA